jgi:hypothetical protein
VYIHTIMNLYDRDVGRRAAQHCALLLGVPNTSQSIC